MTTSRTPKASRAANGAIAELLVEIPSDASRRLASTAIEQFAERGYHATTTRDISVGAGMSPAAMYVYYGSKEDLLFEVCRIAHDSAFAAIKFSADGAGDDPDARLQAIVHDMTLWHARHATLARVAQYQLTALSESHYKVVATVRRKTESIMRAEIERGIRDKTFRTRDVSVSVLALMSMCIDVARWFRVGGRIKPESLATDYGNYAVAMLSGKT